MVYCGAQTGQYVNAYLTPKHCVDCVLIGDKVTSSGLVVDLHMSSCGLLQADDDDDCFQVIMQPYRYYFSFNVGTYKTVY